MTDIVTNLSKTVIFLFEEEHQYPIGTAFIVGYPIPERPDKFAPLIVTAKHVIEGYVKVIGRFSDKSGTRPTGLRYDLNDLRANGDVWEHPDKGVDIIVFRSQHYTEAEYRPIPMEFIGSQKTFIDEDIKVTDRVIFPCLLDQFMGTTQNYPVTKDGSIALIPKEPVPLKYDIGEKLIQTKQELILINATSIPGASGAPIFLWPGPRIKGNAYNLGGTKPWLLGIMHGFYPASPRELIEIPSKGKSYAFSENSGIAISFPSWRLLEILNGKDVSTRIQEIIDL